MGTTAMARFLPRVLWITCREFQVSMVPLRASALTFTVILALVPVLALGTAVLKGIGAGKQMRTAAYRYIDSIDQAYIPGFDTTPAVPPAPTLGQPEPGQSTDTPISPPQQTFTQHLRRAADTLFDYVEKTDFTALGAFGVLGLLFAVVTVLGSLQQSLNTIWHTQEGRPFGRRLIDFLALMLLMPLAVNMAFAVEASLQSPHIFEQIQAILPVAWFRHLVLALLPMGMVVGVFTIFYRFIPNARVRFLPAVSGAVISGCGWFLIQVLYVKLQVGVAKSNAIYGSFATLPLFALWMYLGWLVFFSGAVLTYALQNWRWYLPHARNANAATRMSIAFAIVEHVHQEFRQRRLVSRLDLARTIGQPETLVQQVVDQLLTAGILRLVDDASRDLLPSTPEEMLDPAEVVDMVLGGPPPGFSHHPLADIATAAARAAVSGIGFHPAPAEQAPEASK